MIYVSLGNDIIIFITLYVYDVHTDDDDNDDEEEEEEKVPTSLPFLPLI